MLLTVEEYRNRVSNHIDGLVSELQELTGRTGQEERMAWHASLPVLSDMISTPDLSGAHLFFNGSGHLDVEYQLPAASSWCDVVLLGRKARQSSAVIIELKHWLLTGDRPGAAEGLINRQGRDHLHPSDQVRGYTEYCRRFHTAVQDADAVVDGCVLFTRSGNAGVYEQAPNDGLTSAFPVFTVSSADLHRRFSDYVSDRITDPDEEFAEAFASGGYRQERGFVAQIGKQLLDPENEPVVLLENQRSAFTICRDRIARYVDDRTADASKRVIVVEGPPGSGKSVVAAKLWAALVTDPLTQTGDLVFTTTSSSQNSNWEALFRQAAGHPGAHGVVKKANQYYPATTVDIGKLRREHGTELFADAQAWRQHLAALRAMRAPRPGSEDDCYLVSIVDEAHALINPEHTAGRGKFGFASMLGPQAYHIMRASRLTVFFLDPEQGFRDRENTTVDDIRAWAEELGAQFESISLAGAQFRCAGSKEYVDWLESVFSGMDARFAARNAQRWRAQSMEYQRIKLGRDAAEKPKGYRVGQVSRGMLFELMETPFDLDDVLRGRTDAGSSVRLLASYARPWSTRDFPSPHEAPPQTWDFQIDTSREGKPAMWRRPWNIVDRNGTDYTAFIQARPGSAIAEDPLCEVGCPYAVRGFDFDYVGLLWLSDFVWRDGRWIVQPEHVHESGLIRAKQRVVATHGSDTDAYQMLLDGVRQAYRILLTRAMKGMYVWVEDGETREYLRLATS